MSPHTIWVIMRFGPVGIVWCWCHTEAEAKKLCGQLAAADQAKALACVYHAFPVSDVPPDPLAPTKTLNDTPAGPDPERP
jgi:hypothetical protein